MPLHFPEKEPGDYRPGLFLIIIQVIWPIFFYELVTACLYPLTRDSLGRYGTMCLGAFLSSAFFLYIRKRRRERYGTVCAYNRAGEGPRSFWDFMACRSFWIRGTVIALQAVFLSAALNILLMVTGISAMSEEYARFSEDFFAAPLWLQILTTGILVPLVEELLFRGLAYERIRFLAGVWPAAIASALIFGVSHGNAAQGIYAFLLGLPLALTYERDGLGGAVWFHACCNLASVAASLVLGMG